jgi:hypothetical protein
MAYDSIFSTTTSLTTSVGAKKAVAGNNPRQESDTAVNAITWTLGTGAGQINESYVALLSIAGAGSQTLDLTALTDQLGNALLFTTVKSIQIQLLGTADKSFDKTTVGTACSGITVGNAAATQFGGVGYPLGDLVTSVITLANREQFSRARPDATGWVVSGTIKSLKFLNNDGAVTAKIMVMMLGCG